MKKKIGIISCDGWLRSWDNYGTLFQNYALQKFLRERGFETFWILTKPNGLGGGPREIAERILRRVRRGEIFPAAKNFVAARVFGRREHRKIVEFNAAHPRFFSEFFEKHVPHTRDRFSPEDLAVRPPEADAYIAGSDQIWGGVSTTTFLGFGRGNALRIAYAASTAWGSRDEEWLARAREMLPRFDAVSVREPEGVEVCVRAGRADAVHVADPTLLLEKEDYLRIVREEGADSPFPRKTVLAYFLNVKKKEQLPWAAVLELARERAAELKIVPLQGAELAIPEEYVFTPSPAQWLNAYDKADCVLTNSFHGTVFAVIMRKPFLVVLQKGKTAVENCRFFSLLKKLGLEARIFDEIGGGVYLGANGRADRLGLGFGKTRRVSRGIRGVPRAGAFAAENAVEFPCVSVSGRKLKARRALRRGGLFRVPAACAFPREERRAA